MTTDYLLEAIFALMTVLALGAVVRRRVRAWRLRRATRRAVAEYASNPAPLAAQINASGAQRRIRRLDS